MVHVYCFQKRKISSLLDCAVIQTSFSFGALEKRRGRRKRKKRNVSSKPEIWYNILVHLFKKRQKTKDNMWYFLFQELNFELLLHVCLRMNRSRRGSLL